jgi:peptidoglycan hydrolase CwlO-like protein
LTKSAKSLAKQFIYANQVIKVLEKEKKELIAELDNLFDQVEQAKQRVEEIEKPVNKWINDMENLLNR